MGQAFRRAAEVGNWPASRLSFRPTFPEGRGGGGMPYLLALPGGLDGCPWVSWVEKGAQPAAASYYLTPGFRHQMLEFRMAQKWGEREKKEMKIK